jgi:hypothetical protein
MERVKLSLVLLLPLVMAVSCGTEPTVDNTPPPGEIDTVPEDIVPSDIVLEDIIPPPDEDTAFDPSSISQELFNSTKIEVQRFIEEVNQVIRNKNYTAWKAELSPSFFARISSGEFLQQISDADAMKNRGIVLKSAEDYFNYVVVPSRVNSRVDDIEFISQNRVKAYTVITNREGQTQRLRLYDLEYFGNLWRIIN